MKLLLHTCCGPCSAYPINILRQNGFDIHCLFYNPNIHPYDEFDKRRQSFEKFMKIKNVAFTVFNEFMQQKWESYYDEKITRCEMCYRIRMEQTAQFAKMHGFEAFSTTLLVSPYQKHELIKTICMELSSKYGVEFVYIDFRAGFRVGQREAREAGLYMQKYCGCIKSIRKDSCK